MLNTTKSSPCLSTETRDSVALYRQGQDAHLQRLGVCQVADFRCVEGQFSGSCEKDATKAFWSRGGRPKAAAAASVY